MRPQVDHIQLPPKTWQAVTEHALRELSYRDSKDTFSRIENLRPSFLAEETETAYGRQIWCFESMNPQNADGRRNECGALEFSLEYGLLELVHCCWFQNDKEREEWICERITPASEPASCCGMTRIWIYLAILGVLFLAIGWTVSLLRYLNVSI